MAFIHGKNTFISVDGDDLSGYTDSSDLNTDVDHHETSVFGDDDKTYLAGLRDSTYTISGNYFSGVAGPGQTLRPLQGGASVILLRQVEGTGSTLPQDSVSVLVGAYTESSPVGDKVTWSCDLQGTGPIDTTAQT